MNPTLERCIEVGDAVGCEKHHALVVFKFLQEDCESKQWHRTGREVAQGLPDIRRLRRMSAVVRASRNISHSSSRRIAFHLSVNSRTSSRESSTSAAVSP